MKKTKTLDTDFFEKDLKKRLKNRKFREAFYMSRLVRRISSQISEIRGKKHLSQKQLADKAHVPQQEISNIENGKRNITLVTLEKIAAGFGGTIDVNFKF
jgi:DNA-binding XRE family transcriptional regulator